MSTATSPEPSTTTLAGSNDSTRGRNLGLLPLVGLIIGSMIGGGIFHLPAQIAGVAGSGPMLIGWLVFGLGMIFLSQVFQNLGRMAPKVDGGVYGYARDGFGDYLGFATSWGYWLSTFSGSVGYLVLAFASLGHYFPMFGGGNTLPAIIGASVILWIVHLLILSGIKEATFVNTIVTAAKVLPILVFIVLGIAAFKVGVFSADFWGQALQVPADDGTSAGLGSSFDQVRNMMILLVWYFLGIESASIYAARARKRNDASRATLIGFGVVLFMLVAVNVLAFGITERARLIGYSDPSLAGVMRDVVGPWGEGFVIVGVIVSVLGAYLSWMLMSSEILMYPGKDGLLPRFFGKENRKGVPVAGLWLTSVFMQIMLVVTYFNDSTYTSLTVLAGAMALLPYLWTAVYQVIIAAQGRHDYGIDLYTSKGQRIRSIVIGVIATIFALFLLWAGGLLFVAAAALWILIGTLLYVWARKERGLPLFAGTLDYVFLALVVVGAIVGVVLFANGTMATLL